MLDLLLDIAIFLVTSATGGRESEPPVPPAPGSRELQRLRSTYAEWAAERGLVAKMKATYEGELHGRKVTFDSGVRAAVALEPQIAVGVTLDVDAPLLVERAHVRTTPLHALAGAILDEDELVHAVELRAEEVMLTFRRSSHPEAFDLALEILDTKLRELASRREPYR